MVVVLGGNGSRSSDSGYSKSSSDSSYSKRSSEDEEVWSEEEEEQSMDDEVVIDDGLAMVVREDGHAMVVLEDDLAMVVVSDDDLTMVVVPNDDLAMVVVPDDGLAMVIPQLGDRTMPIVVEEYIPQPGPGPILGLRRSKRIRMMKEKGNKLLFILFCQHHLKIIHGKDDKVKPEANHWKTNNVQEGRTNGVQEGSGVINDDPEYNPKEDEVVVHKVVKALKEYRMKRPGVKKTASKKRKISETSVAIPPGRVMAPPPGQTKRIMERHEPAPDRVTRQKANMVVATDHQENPLCMDFESSVQMRDEFPPMDEEITLCVDESGTGCLCLRRGAPSIDRNVVISEEEQQENFEMNMDLETIKTACKDILQKNSKNRRHKIKKKYFDTVAANKVSTKSPVPDLTDGEWQALVEMWSTPRHKKEERKGEELSAIDLFKATHNSKNHGFSEPVKIAIDASVLEGEEPKCDAKIVEEVLKTEVKQSTLFRNVGLQSSSYNSGKATVVVAAHVRDLEQKLERLELQDEVMQEEMAAIQMKAREYEVAPDKELELLRRRSQEQEEKLAHLMALFRAKAS
ncbi:hypothetical protein D1007_28674 [Hordeum vulgare]|nr:hypothetical protein D1007_28674 [Hordeum vulgare]